MIFRQDLTKEVGGVWKKSSAQAQAVNAFLRQIKNLFD